MAPCCITPDLSLCTQGPCCGTAPDPSPELQALASELALGFLWAATGRRFARTCNPITVRPCKPDTCKPMSVHDIIYFEANRQGDGNPGNMGVLNYSPTLIDGAVFNIACGCPKGCCTCKADCEIRLPGPVCEVQDVTIDGVPRGASLWTVYDHRTLVMANRGTTVIRPFDTVPFPAPFTLAVGGAVNAITSPFDGKPMVELTDVGTNYQITVSADPLDINTCRQDLMVELEFPPGGGTLTVGQPPNGHWTADVVAGGGDPTLTKVGNTLTVGAATKPNEPIRVRIRAEEGYCVSTLSLTQTAGSPMSIYQLQWTNLDTTDCGVDRWTPSEKAGRLLATAQPYNLGDRWTFEPNRTGGTGGQSYGGNVWGPLESPGQAFYSTFPALPGGVLQFDYASAGAPGPEAVAFSPAFDSVNAPSGAYEWDSAVYPNGTILAVGDTIMSSSISDPDIDDGSRYKLTVTAGTATVVSARALTLSDDFSATVEFQEIQVTGDCCPPCQDYNKALGEVGTWSVTYTYGERWPAGAAQVAGLLACEFGQILAGQDNGLPANIVSLVRQGVSIEMPNPFELAKNMLTGLKLVDLWIKAQNPLGLTHRARVWSPDLPIVRRET